MKLSRTAVGVMFLGLGLFLVTASATLLAQSATTAWNETTAAAYLDDRQDWWTTWETASRENDTYCISCHGGLPYALARPHLTTTGTHKPTASERGLLANVTKRVRAWDEIGPYYTDEQYGVPKTTQSRGTEAILNAFVLSRYDALTGSLSADTRMAFDHLWAEQEQAGEHEGGWSWLVFGLQPWESDDAPFYGGALAAVAVGMAPEGYAATHEVQPRLDRLRRYFARHYADQPLFNRVTLLWASAALPGLLDPEQKTDLIGEVFEAQRDDGGWSLTSLGAWERRDDTSLITESDGYATGLVLFTLQEAGLSDTDRRVAKGLSWLRQNQDPENGSWPGYSLNKDRDPASDTGRFMSDVATAYAVLALSDDD